MYVHCTFQSNIWWNLLMKIAIWQTKTSLLIIVNAKQGSIHDAHMTSSYNTRISNGLRFILNLNTFLFVLKLTKNASSTYFYRANKQENNIWAYISVFWNISTTTQTHVLCSSILFEFNLIKAGLDFRKNS